MGHWRPYSPLAQLAPRPAAAVGFAAAAPAPGPERADRPSTIPGRLRQARRNVTGRSACFVAITALRHRGTSGAVRAISARCRTLCAAVVTPGAVIVTRSPIITPRAALVVSASTLVARARRTEWRVIAAGESTRRVRTTRGGIVAACGLTMRTPEPASRHTVLGMTAVTVRRTSVTVRRTSAAPAPVRGAMRLAMLAEVRPAAGRSRLVVIAATVRTPLPPGEVRPVFQAALLAPLSETMERRSVGVLLPAAIVPPGSRLARRRVTMRIKSPSARRSAEEVVEVLP